MKEFTPFRLDPADQCLWRSKDFGRDERVVLSPKAFAILQYLAEHAGRLVTLDEFLETVWPGSYVQPQVLKSQILEIRKALGDDAKQPRYIETVHRRGYRFIAEVLDRAVAAVQAPRAAPAVPLAGREPVLNQLWDCLSLALQKQRQIVFVTGEPGIGKTALADAFQTQARGEWPEMLIARGQCVEGYGGTEAFYPVLEALGQMCRNSGGNRIIASIAAQAPTLVAQFPWLRAHARRDMRPGGSAIAADRMLREISGALDEIAAERALLLVLEDLQWADPATVDLISSLSRSRRPARLMLMGTYRPVEIATEDRPVKRLQRELLVHKLCREIALEPLSETQIAGYLRDRSPPGEAPEGLARLLYQHTEGNPLFMAAALDHMVRRGWISRHGGGWKLLVPPERIDHETPDNLQQMIEAQIERLSVEEQRMLEAASVVGTVFATALVASTDSEQEALDELLQRLANRRYLVRPAQNRQFQAGRSSTQWEFMHALHANVLYRRLSSRRRARLHAGIAKRLIALSGGHPEAAASELTFHLERGREDPSSGHPSIE